MIKVLHFDYYPIFFQEWIDAIGRRMREMPDVNYEYIGAKYTSFSRYQEELEGKLADKDVFLVHPGVMGQKTVIEEYPIKFPNLKIGLVVSGVSEYHKGEGRIELFDYFRTEDIINFVLSAEKEKIDGRMQQTSVI